MYINNSKYKNYNIRYSKKSNNILYHLLYVNRFKLMFYANNINLTYKRQNL